MSRTDVFRAAIRQAELDRATNGSGLVLFEIAVLAAAAGLLADSFLIGLFCFFALFIGLAAISTSPRAVAITLSIVFVVYAALFFLTFYGFWTAPAEPIAAATDIIIMAVISLGLASIPTAYHEGAFRTQDDLSRS